MANCALTIELDEPDTPRMGGEPISGTVIVTVSEPTKCDGLEVATYWCTHGRGNIDRGDIDQTVVFQGSWDPHREYRYRFSLKTGGWPPTYYGTYLNVGQWVTARAKVPWAKDPKTEAEVVVIAKESPEDLKPTAAVKEKSTSIIGWVIGGIVIVFVLALVGLFALFILPFIIVIGGLVWFFRVFLPKQLTGSIDCVIEPKRAAPGGAFRGVLKFTPKRNMTINRIAWTVTGYESCVSGSGSNRKTHRHELLKKSHDVATAGELRFGQPQSFEFNFAVPANAPPSLKFSNNELTWSGELRIDIARWPDWVKTFPLTVTHSGAAPNAIPGSLLGSEPPVPLTEEDQWFEEVLRQVSKTSEDPALVNTVIDAVRDHVFTIRVDIADRFGEPPPAFPEESGVWMYAIHHRTDVELALAFASEDEAPPEDTQQWTGQAVILGYDHEFDCLVMRIVRLERRLNV